MFVDAKVTITPQMMAEAFWEMCDHEQAEFLAELHKQVTNDAYALGEAQWYYLGALLLKEENKEARDMLMSIAAPLYLNVLRVAEKIAKGE